MNESHTLLSIILDMCWLRAIKSQLTTGV